MSLGSRFFYLNREARFQNTAEFIAVVIGCVYLAQRGYCSIKIKLVGDSRTSLKWSEIARFKGMLNKGSSMLYILLGTTFDFYVGDTKSKLVC